MNQSLRVLLADDEPLATRRLRRLLSMYPDVVVVGECGTGAEAIEAVDRERPDLLLLDVQMPDGDGFEVLAGVDSSTGPLVVFVTAFDDYAVRAFEAAALDYLVKPVRRARLDTALDRARDRIALRSAAGRDAAGEVVEIAPPVIADRSPDRPASDRFLVDRGRHMDVVMLDDIDWIEAADNDVVVHVGAERHRYRRTMEQV